jgi:hypothetical protein
VCCNIGFAPLAPLTSKIDVIAIMLHMTPTNTTFKELMQHIDQDFRSIRASLFERQKLYYKVTIDQRQTDVLGRKAPVPYENNNAIKITFLINTPRDNQSYTTLYLTEIDIITILSELNATSYEHIKDYLVSIYCEQIDHTGHSVRFDRAALVSDIDTLSLTANREVLAVPITANNPDISTPFGFMISYQSLCDLLSLTLSTENADKLKITVTKYCLFSTLLRAGATRIAVPAALAHVSTIGELESIYAGKWPKQVQRFDKDTFTAQVQDEFFSSI